MTSHAKILGQTALGLILSGPTLVFWYQAIWDQESILGDKLLFVTGVLSPLLFVTSTVLAIIKPTHPELLIAAAINGTPILALLVLILFRFFL